MRTLRILFTLLGVAVLVGITVDPVVASDVKLLKNVFSDVRQLELPREMTKIEYEIYIENFYSEHNLRIIVDLRDENGIDPSLLPPFISAMIEDDVIITGYRESVPNDHVSSLLNLYCESLRSEDEFASEGSTILGITCRSREDVYYDIEAGKWFGSVQQFNRTIALRYDGYEPCGQTCYGYEIEQEIAWWKRSASNWTVKSAKMYTILPPGENFCTGALDSLNYGSTYFNPTWSGNQTPYYSISGFPNKAIIPWPQGHSTTQGDIYQGTTLKYNDAKGPYHFWSPY